MRNMFKVNNESTRSRFSVVFNVNFENISPFCSVSIINFVWVIVCWVDDQFIPRLFNTVFIKERLAPKIFMPNCYASNLCFAIYFNKILENIFLRCLSGLGTKLLNCNSFTTATKTKFSMLVLKITCDIFNNNFK